MTSRQLQGKATKPDSHEKFLSNMGPDQRAALEKLCKAIRSAAPSAEECISYGLPAFRLDGRPLVAFGATDRHCAFYLMSDKTVPAYADDLAGYDTSKGTIRFQPDRPPPAALVKKLVRARIAENAGKTTGGASPARRPSAVKRAARVAR